MRVHTAFVAPSHSLATLFGVSVLARPLALIRKLGETLDLHKWCRRLRPCLTGQQTRRHLRYRV